MTPVWQWDETLFAGTAPYYDRGRLPYAAGLADAMAAALSLDGGGRLLDVGCGPGTVTLRLAALFQEVVGLDADAEMLTEAARLAVARGITSARWVHKRAEALPADLGTFRVITFAASFHWMDRPKVAATVFTMLEPGGALVFIDNHHHDNGIDNSALPRPPVPVPAILNLVESYLGPGRRAGQFIRNSSPDNEDGVFRAAGFVGPQAIRVRDGRVLDRTIDDVVAESLSMSNAAPHLFGPRLPEFEADLRRLLAEASPTRLFSVRLPDNELKIWRRANAVAGQGGHS